MVVCLLIGLDGGWFSGFWVLMIGRLVLLGSWKRWDLGSCFGLLGVFVELLVWFEDVFL